MPSAPPQIAQDGTAASPSSPPDALPASPQDGAWHLVTGLGGNRDIDWKWTGPDALRVVYQIPAGTNPTPLVATVAANVITVALPLTGAPGSASMTMTASELMAVTIPGLPPTGTLTRSLAPGSDGSGVLLAMAEAAMSRSAPTTPPAIAAAGAAGNPAFPPNVLAGGPAEG